MEVTTIPEDTQIISNTSTYWETNNPVIQKKTGAFSIDTREIRIGTDGLTKWSDLVPFHYTSECVPIINHYHKGDNPPDNTDLLWINTENNTMNYWNGTEWIAIVGVFVI